MFVRIPVRMVVGVGDEIGGDEQKEEKSKYEMPRKDMTIKHEMTFWDTLRILSQCRCIGETACMHEKNVRMRAYGEVFGVHTPSRAWQLLPLARETPRQMMKTEQRPTENVRLKRTAQLQKKRTPFVSVS